MRAVGIINISLTLFSFLSVSQQCRGFAFMSMSDVTNRQHYMPAMNYLASPDASSPLQFQSSSLGYGIEPSAANDGMNFLGRPSLNNSMPDNHPDKTPSRGGGFFAKLFGAIGSVFGKLGAIVGSITTILGPLVSFAAPFFGPLGVAVSAAINIGGKALRYASDRVESAMGMIRNLFKS